MPRINWTIHDIPLWLPDTWADVDSYLFEIDTTIKRYNESITLLGSRPAASREDYELKSVKWSPWRTLVWLWRREWVVLRGFKSYLDPRPQVIDTVLVERSVRHFSYDGDHMRHLASGDVWYAVKAIDAEAFAVETSQGELSFPAEPPVGDKPTEPEPRPADSTPPPPEEAPPAPPPPGDQPTFEQGVELIRELCRAGNISRSATTKEMFRLVVAAHGEDHWLVKVDERQQRRYWAAAKQTDQWPPKKPLQSENS